MYYLLLAALISSSVKEANALLKTIGVGFKSISKMVVNTMISELMTLHYSEVLAKEYGDSSITYPNNNGLIRIVKDNP
jgi:hypothetical protein